MKKVRMIHFWIGIVAMVFLLIQSVTGLTLYFSEDGAQGGGQPNGMQAPPSGNPGGQGGNTDDADKDSAQSEQSTAPGMGGGGQFNGTERPEGMPGTEDSTVKSIHEGVIGLISGISLLLMSLTGLTLAIMMGLNKRKKRNITKKL